MRNLPPFKITPDKLYTVCVLALPVILSFLCGLGLLGCAARNPAPAPAPKPLVDHTVTVTWNQSFVNNPACSSTVTASCISGFDEGYLDTTGKQVQQHTDAAAVCAGATQPEACSTVYTGILPIGAVQFYVATTFMDQKGAAGVTAAALSAAVQVPADSSTNVTVTIAP